MIWLRSLGYAIGRAFGSLRRRPGIAALTVGVMTISLVLVGLAYMAEHNVRNLSRQWGSGIQMIVYLEEGTSARHAEQLANALGALQAVESVTFIPPEDALVHLQRSLGQHDELLKGIEASFLPASLEVRLVEGVRDLVAAHPVIERLEATPGVEEVEFLGSWVDDFTLLVGKVKRTGMWLVAVVGLIGIFTVVATMRLSAASRMSERRVLELMGAPGILRTGPTVIEGAVQGLLGAAAAALILWFLYSSGAPMLASALSSSLGVIELRFLATKDVAQLILFGVSLGIVGGLLTSYSQVRQS